MCQRTGLLLVVDGLVPELGVHAVHVCACPGVLQRGLSLSIWVSIPPQASLCAFARDYASKCVPPGVRVAMHIVTARGVLSTANPPSGRAWGRSLLQAGARRPSDSPTFGHESSFVSGPPRDAQGAGLQG